MPYKVRCPRCQHIFEADDNLSGQKTKCPGCAQPIVVPPRRVPTQVEPEKSEYTLLIVFVIAAIHGLAIFLVGIRIGLLLSACIIGGLGLVELAVWQRNRLLQICAALGHAVFRVLRAFEHWSAGVLLRMRERRMYRALARPKVIKCIHCGGNMFKTSKDSGGCGITTFLALVLFTILGSCCLTFVFPFGIPVFIVAILVLAVVLAVTGNKEKVWKCSQCGAFVARM